jgi:hypothetical protein
MKLRTEFQITEVALMIDVMVTEVALSCDEDDLGFYKLVVGEFCLGIVVDS